MTYADNGYMLGTRRKCIARESEGESHKDSFDSPPINANSWGIVLYK